MNGAANITIALASSWDAAWHERLQLRRPARDLGETQLGMENA